MVRVVVTDGRFEGWNRLRSSQSETTKICMFGRRVWNWPNKFICLPTVSSEEKFGLVSQMRRAAISVPSNIAEGQARNTTGEFVQFLSHAEGSAAELDTQLRLSTDLGYCVSADLSEVFRLLTDVQKMLKRLRQSLAKP